MGGKVQSIHIERGQAVEARTLLFELDPEPEKSLLADAEILHQIASSVYKDQTKGLRPAELAAMDASIVQAEAALAYSKKEFERAETLYKDSKVSESRFDLARAAYLKDSAAVDGLKQQLRVAKQGARDDRIEAAHGELRRAGAALDRARWRLLQKQGIAPEGALVMDVLYSEGEYVLPGYPVIVLLPPGGVRARFFVPESALSTLRQGQRVIVSADGLAQPIEGHINFISPQAEYTPPFIYSKDNRQKMVFMAEASFAPVDAQRLNPGQPVDVRVGP